MMKLLVFVVCLLVSTLAAPAPQSESNEQVAAHANQALRWMEMYRLYQQQGVIGNPFLPASRAPTDPAMIAVVDAAPAQPADVRPPASIAVEEASEEEAEQGHIVPKAAAPAVPLNSDEVEEAEEVESAQAEPAVVEAPPVEAEADPAVAVEPTVADVPVDAAPVDAAAVDVAPVDVVSIDTAPVAPEAVVDVAAPTAADPGAAPPAVEVDMTGVAADRAAL